MGHKALGWTRCPIRGCFKSKFRYPTGTLNGGSTLASPALAKKLKRNSMLAEKAEVVDTTTSPDAAPHSGASIPPKKRNGVLRGVLISLCSTVFTLAMVEGVFRVYQATAPKPFLFNVPPRDYLPESAFRARDFYYPPEKAPGVFRIIAIGDSFTFGGKMHFDDSYSKRLERMLNLNDKQRKVEVLNWGISGYSSFHEVQLVRTAITQFNPDLVIVQITLNDAELQPYRVTHRYQNKRGAVILKNPSSNTGQASGIS